jgi:hypothetical protein
MDAIRYRTHANGHGLFIFLLLVVIHTVLCLKVPCRTP